MKSLSRFLKDESGATAIEYGLIAALIAIGIAVSLTLLRDQLNGLFFNIAARLQASYN